MSASTEKERRFHIERSRLVRAGSWNADAERELRERLFSERPKIRMRDVGRR